MMNFKRLWFALILALLLGLALSDTAFAQAPSTLKISVPSEPTESGGLRKKWEGLWNLRLRQKQFEDELNNHESLTEFRLLADLRYKPLENFDFHLVPRLTFVTGYQQSEEEPTNRGTQWGVREAAAEWFFAGRSSLAGGALDQGFAHPSLLLDDQAFPALRLQTESTSSEFFSLGLSAETAIPTSSSLSTRTQESEKTPSFASASVFAKLQKSKVEGELRLGSFGFQNLPQNVANDSTFLGNTTISQMGTADHEFLYDYRGLFASGEIRLRAGRLLSLWAQGEWTRNDQAPQGLNQGSRAVLGGDWTLNRQWQVQPFYEFFKIEPDAAVALYNGDWLSTNRVGYRAGLGLAYRKILKLTLSGGERDVFYTTPFQQRERTWLLKLETEDAAI